MNPDAVNLVDLGALCLVIAGLVGGLRSGALPQIGGLIGAILGGLVLVAMAPALHGWVVAMTNPTRGIVVIAVLAVAIGAGEVAGSAAGRVAGASLGPGVLGTLDRALGGVVGVGQAVVTVWLAGSLLALGPLTTLASQAQTSVAVRVTTQALPPVSEVAGEIGSLIDSSGLPQLFVGLEPVPAPPVDTPATAEARRIAAASVASTLEIDSRACGYELTGTGFVVSAGYVVTNAHVVAGATETTVSLADESLPATVVLFDHGLDIAVLHVPGLRAAPLRLAKADPVRGTLAAALGHPGGAPLTVIPAAVTGTYAARGRDLYGKRDITRDIIELRAAIERGDSGGPLVLEDGTVGGVVFAESRSDPEVGYALSPVAVGTDVAAAVGRTDAVSTGACVRSS